MCRPGGGRTCNLLITSQMRIQLSHRSLQESESTLEHNMPTGPYLCLYQILSKYFKPHTQGFSLEIHSWEVTRKQTQQRLSLLHVTHLLLDTNASTKYYQNMSKGVKVMERKILASGEITT